MDTLIRPNITHNYNQWHNWHRFFYNVNLLDKGCSYKCFSQLIDKYLSLSGLIIFILFCFGKEELN